MRLVAENHGDSVSLGESDELVNDVNPQIMVFELCGERILIVSESCALCAYIRCYLHSFESKIGESTIRITILSAVQRNGLPAVQILCTELAFAVQVDDGAPAWFAFKDLIERIVLRCRAQMVVLRSAAVARPDGRVALIVGPSGSGKTSLLAGLLLRQYTLVCDGICVLYPRGEVEALPFALLLDDSTLDSFPELRVCLQPQCSYDGVQTRFWIVNPSDPLGKSIPGRRHQISHCIFLIPAFGESSEVEPATRERVRTWLHASHVPSYATRRFTMKAHTYCERMFAVSRNLARHTSCIYVRNGNVDAVLRLVCEELDKSRGLRKNLPL